MNKTFTDLHNQALTMGEYIEQMREAYEVLELENKELDEITRQTVTAYEAMEKENEALERERDALVAYSERVKNLLNSVGHVGVDFGFGPYELSKEEIEEARKLFCETPAQSLNHSKAQVEEETIALDLECCHDQQSPFAVYTAIKSRPRKYAKQVGASHD